MVAMRSDDLGELVASGRTIPTVLENGCSAECGYCAQMKELGRMKWKLHQDNSITGSILR